MVKPEEEPLKRAMFFAAVHIWYGLASVGYLIRPYDMLADRRRWRWQPCHKCQHLTITVQPERTP